MDNKGKAKINHNAVSLIWGILLILFLLFLFGKLIIYDCVIGTKVYDENDIVIRYHRYINIFSVNNNSDDTIYMHYQSGRCRKDANYFVYYIKPLFLYQ